MSADAREKLIAGAKRALLESVKPAYEALIAKLEALEKIATDDDGAWKFPEGADFYNFRLRTMTTTTLDSDEIHALGLREVARIHREMDAIQRKVGFKGDRQAFFKHLRDDPQFYYPNTPEGKAAYLQRATEIIDTILDASRWSCGVRRGSWSTPACTRRSGRGCRRSTGCGKTRRTASATSSPRPTATS